MKRLTSFNLLNTIVKRSESISRQCIEIISCNLDYQLHNRCRPGSIDNLVRFLIAIKLSENQWQSNMTDATRTDITESHASITTVNDPAIVSVFSSHNSAVIGNKSFKENPRSSSPLNVFNSQNSYSLMNGRYFVPCFYRQTTPVLVMPGRTCELSYVEEPPQKRPCPTQQLSYIPNQAHCPNPQLYYPTPVPYVMAEERNPLHAMASVSRPTAAISSPSVSGPQQHSPDSRQERQLHTSSSASVREEQTQKRQKDISLLPRSWEYTTYGRKHSHHPRGGLEFTVMSYNVLSQTIMEKNLWLYPHCKDDVLEWDTRKRLLLDELQAYDADILCLQEVECEHYTDFFHPTLRQLGYFGLFKKRTGSYTDGCATFYKKDKFEFETSAAVEYLKGYILDRDNIALLVILKPIRKDGQQSSRSICIANTHILFNPRRGDVKLAQLMVLYAELDKIADNRNDGSDNYCPMILCGDLNSEPNSDIYNFTIEGYLQYEDLLVREMSGQREGQHGRDVYLAKDFFSKALRISDDCQYFYRLKDNDGCQPVSNTPGASRSTTSSVHSQGDVVDVACNEENDGSDSVSNTPSAIQSTTSSVHSQENLVDLACNEENVPNLKEESESDRNLATTKDVDSIHDDSDQQTIIHATGILQHRLNFVSVYKHAIERLNFKAREVTTQHSNADCTVDYIMYSVAQKDTEFTHNKLTVRNLQEGPLRLLGRFGLMSSMEVGKLGGLPNKVIGSDHLSLLAKFLLE